MSTRRLTTLGLSTALVALATMMLQIPLPSVQGYINLGDTLIFIIALFLGPIPGLIAGGLGSALADLLLGYAAWAPATLVIKGLEGLVVGYIGHQVFRQGGLSLRPVFGMGLGGLIMATGYLGVSSLIYGFPAALATYPSDLLQAGGSLIIALPVLMALSRIRWGR